MGDILDQLFGRLGAIVGSFLDNPVVSFVLQLSFIYLVVLWLAAAYWVFRDASRRIRSPIAPYLASAPVILATPLLFVLVLLVWRILRPPETVAQARERGLATEALEAEAAERLSCATCGRKIDQNWILCPTCRSRLARVCPNCNRLVGLDWSICAWCGRDFETRAG